MSIRSRSSRSFAWPAGGRLYRQSFVRHVHQLVAAGYRRLDKSTLSHQEETVITGLLVREIRNYVEGPMAPTWAASFAVHDDPPIESFGRLGRSRPRVDIELERVLPGPRPRFQFEAKRLYRWTSVSDYLGTGGLQNFTSGTYATGHADAGMLGYVQARSVQEWVDQIQERMEAMRQKLLLGLEGSAWSTRSYPELDNSYASLHQRSEGMIAIHHTFLDFR